MTTILNAVKKSIIDEMKEELNNRYYSYETRYLDQIVEECFEKKKDLINLLSKHPNWNPEKLMIQFDTDMERRICTQEVSNFVDWLANKVGGQYQFFAFEQSREFYICDFIKTINRQFFNESMQEQIDAINKLNDNYKLRTNMKASKAIGKICREEGWDKIEGFNQKYAALCDCLSPIKIKRHTCISVNPIDFLLMSNGNSWESCHYIGEKRDSGCYSSGTISYMLDNHSFIFYTVDASYDGTQIEREPKIQRQVFGYNDEVIAQLRLYPQNNDSGAENVYDDIRAIVQKVIADCLNKPNMWIKSTKDISEVVRKGNYATCYPDWKRGNPGASHCSLSTLKDRENGKEFREIVFGAQPICITCGERHYYDGSISCCDNGHTYYCEECGCRIDEDDVYWCGRYEDTPYCEDCVTYCERCGYYHPNDEVQEIDGTYVCNSCIEYGDYYTCEECGEIHHIDYIVTTEDGTIYCEDCANEVTFVCDSCGERLHNDERHYDDVTGCYYCDECYDKLIEERESMEDAIDELDEEIA